VVDTAFLGAARTVRLNSAVLGDLTSSARGAGPAPEPGTTVQVTWAEHHAWLIPA
jgi:TOBE domain